MTRRDSSSSEAGGRRPTLKDVARLAGVSPMTASNVVNGTLKGYNDDTKQKVLQAVEQLGYRAHVGARSLRTDRRMSVGMLIVQSGRRFLADPYITHLLDGLCSGLNQRGYSLVLQGLQPGEISASTLVRHLQTDGLGLLMPGDFAANSVLRSTILALSQPVILFQQALQDQGSDICSIRQDDFEGGRAMCEHLVQRGARNIVAVVPQLDWPAMRARVAGAQQHLAQSGARTRLTVVTSTDESQVATQAALEGYLSSDGKMDAVLAGNDQMAIAAYRMLDNRGLKIPDDVRLAGFNGFDFLGYFGTQLTTVRSPAFELGQLGAYHMVRRIESGVFDSASIVLPTELVIGTTT
jgi:LacI family transcriptional regulator